MTSFCSTPSQRRQTISHQHRHATVDVAVSSLCELRV